MRLRPSPLRRLSVFAAVLAAGCSAAPPPGPVSGTNLPQPETSAAFPRTLTDAKGKTLTLTAPPKRIVSLAASNTEILFALGVGDNVVADTQSEDFPPEAKNRPHISGLASSDLELIIAQNPDLVVADSSINNQIITALETTKIPTLTVRAQTIGEVYEVIQQLGKATGKEEKAKQIVAEMKTRIDSVRNTVSKAKTRPGVLMMYTVTPIYTTGPDSFITDAIQAAGGKSVVTKNLPNNIIGEEEVIALQPDVILCSQTLQAKVKELPGWAQGVPAVRNDRFYSAASGALLVRPAPRLVKGVEDLARYLHPELFSSAATPSSSAKH